MGRPNDEAGMTFTQDDSIKFRRFCQEIINNPRPMDAQTSKREGAYLWCEDWEMIEILKFFFLGRDVYLTEAPPNRLKNNPLWSKEEIIKKADSFMEFYNSADHIIEILRNMRIGTTSRIS